uniref:Specifically androgen-regulated gene protein n=1 Tax=Scophthalmus maximus TaxID=52904 RepID=A0A8D2ZWI6_SCOMX
MPRNDSWPGDVAMETLSSMDGAGSCESVISMNSGYTSEDSMEHLSAEERACLMFLEETIEALEVQEDSGFSNDEPDPGLQAEPAGQTRLNGISSFTSDELGGAEHQTSEPRDRPVSAADAGDLVPASLDLAAPESATGSGVPPSDPQPEALHVAKDGNGNLKIVRSAGPRPGGSAEASGVDVGLIPPPSDFMDKPRPLALLAKAKELPPPAGTSGSKTGAAVDLEQLRQRATGRRTSASPSVTLESPNMPPTEAPPSPSPPAVTGPPPEAAEPRSPPAVAPKPKKLPANIILKTHRSPGGGGGSDGSSGHPVPAASDRGLSDAQRVRIEALRKLGLLKSDESDPGPAPSPKLSPKTRRSWGAPPSPVSPAAPHTPALAPANTYVLSPPPTSDPPPSPPARAAAPDVLPAPAAFCDQTRRQPSDRDPSAGPPLTPPTLTKQLTPPRIIGMKKSATLERSGPGLSSFMAGLDPGEDGQGGGGGGGLSPRQLRNTRPRPASLGSRTEFSGGHGGTLQAGRAAGQEPDSRRPLPAYQHSRDAQKLPRSEGISVLICPRSENEADRRQALKKLGLLRD